MRWRYRLNGLINQLTISRLRSLSIAATSSCKLNCDYLIFFSKFHTTIYRQPSLALRYLTCKSNPNKKNIRRLTSVCVFIVVGWSAVDEEVEAAEREGIGRGGEDVGSDASTIAA